MVRASARCPTPPTRPLFDEAKRLGIRVPSRLCGALRGERHDTPLQHRDPRRPRRQHRWQVPQDPPARNRGAGAGRPVPAPGEALLRGRQSRLPGLASARRDHRHVHLQRPPLAGDVPGHGTEGGGDGGARLQHAGLQHPYPRAEAPAHVPQPRHDAGECVSERLLGGRLRQGRPRRRVRAHRRLVHHRPDRRDRGGGDDRGRRAGDLRHRLLPRGTTSGAPCSTSRSTGASSTMESSPSRPAWSRARRMDSGGPDTA